MNNPYIKSIFFILVFSNFVNFNIASSNSPDSDNLETLDYVLSKIEESGREITSIKAEITIIRTIPLLESEEISKGKLTYQKPKHLHIKYELPRNEINIIDGKYIWIYHIDLKQVEKYDLSGITSSPIDTLFNFGLEESVDQIRKQFDISLVNHVNKDSGKGDKSEQHENGNEKIYELKLTPNDNESNIQYSSIALWVQEGLWLPVIIEFYESGGEIVNRIELKNVHLNKHIPVNAFDLKIPSDVEIIEPLQ